MLEARGSLLTDIRRGQVSVGIRLLLTFALAAALAAVALLILGLADLVLPSNTYQYANGDGTVRTYTRPAIQDEHVGIGLLIAGGVWLFMLSRIWRFSPQHRPITSSIIMGVGIMLLNVIAAVVVAQMVRNEELWVAFFIINGVGCSLLMLTYNLHKYSVRKRVSGEVPISLDCPECGYSMVGLTSSRCPECGREYTLDELVRLQGIRLLPPGGTGVGFVSGSLTHESLHEGAAVSSVRSAEP